MNKVRSSNILVISLFAILQNDIMEIPINLGLLVCYYMPVGEAFRLPFIEIKPFGREGRPLPYKIQQTALREANVLNPKFER